MTFSDWLANADLDARYGSGSPATLYAQAHTGDPGSAGTSNVHGTFSRVAIANDATHWPAAVAGAKTNGLPISFGTTAGLVGLTDVSHISLWTTATFGHCLDYGALDAPLAVSDVADVALLPGSLVITRV